MGSIITCCCNTDNINDGGDVDDELLPMPDPEFTTQVIPTLTCQSTEEEPHVLQACVRIRWEEQQISQCDVCKVEMSEGVPQQKCTICHFFMCLNCVAKKGGLDPNLATIKQDAMTLLNDQVVEGQVGEVKRSPRFVGSAMRLCKYSTMESCALAVARTENVVNALCTQCMKNEDTTTTVKLNVVIAIRNLIANANRVQDDELASNTQVIQALLHVVKHHEQNSTEIVSHALGAITGLMRMDVKSTSLVEVYPTLVDAVIQVGKENMNVQQEVLEVLSQCAKQETEFMRNNLGLDANASKPVPVVKFIAGVIDTTCYKNKKLATSILSTGENIMLLNDAIFLLKTLLLPLVESPNNRSETFLTVQCGSDLVPTLQVLATRTTIPGEIQFAALDFLHVFGIVTVKPRRLVIHYLAATNDGMGITSMTQTRVAPSDLSKAPRTPSSSSRAPTSMVMCKDGTRRRMKMFHVYLLDGDQGETVELVRINDNKNSDGGRGGGLMQQLLEKSMAKSVAESLGVDQDLPRKPPQLRDYYRQVTVFTGFRSGRR
jgi:hypothetical protein